MRNLLAVVCLTAVLAAAGTANAALVLSQIYGGGGATAATTAYDYDYIELFNNSNTAVSLNGYTVQYASATGTAWTTTALSGSINAYSYFLIREGTASTLFTNALPAADVIGATGTTGSLSLSATNGKVALVNGTSALGGSSPSALSFVDLIGYGNTAGTPANNTTGNLVPSTVTNQTAVIRDQGGLATTFTVGTPNPHNSLSPANSPVTPTPIPAAAWLLGSGLLGLVGIRRRLN
jgi:predicted extracellular nuclease